MLIAMFVMATPSIAEDDVATHLQNISVTVKSPGEYGEGQGSGTLVTRELKLNDKSDKTVKVNLVITAAHVVDNLKTQRTVIDPKTGTKRQIIEFRDAQIVQELKENGRRVGEIKMDARVIRYSDATDDEDIAILQIRKRGFVDVNAKFYLEDKIPPIGTQLFHVGSLLGQVGANSMTTGIISQHGRVLQLGTGDGTVFDQTTATAFPGSSGGGIYLTNGLYVGMLVRGAGEGFNLIVPIRRMRNWADKVDATWILDPTAKAPTLEELNNSKSIEGLGISFSKEDKKSREKAIEKKYGIHFWLNESKTALLPPTR